MVMETGRDLGKGWHGHHEITSLERETIQIDVYPVRLSDTESKSLKIFGLKG